MNGGEISENIETSNGGGGVYINYDGTFTMKGGKISENTSKATIRGGGGVFMLNGSTFTMYGGEISGNTAIGNGGGVYVDSGGNFTKKSANGNAVIYGSNASSVSLQNIATGGNGHAVYVADGPKQRDTTTGANVALDSGQSGAGSGWEE
jgi:hypothetical protein